MCLEYYLALIKVLNVFVEQHIDIHVQGGAKVGLQLGVCETQSLFLYYYVLVIVLFSTCKTVHLLLPHACIQTIQRLIVYW